MGFAGAMTLSEVAKLGNIADELRHPMTDAYLAEQAGTTE